MKTNLYIHYENGGRPCSANFCLDKKQMQLLEESEAVCNNWPDLVLNRYAVNTSSAEHRRRINSIMDDCDSANFWYVKIK